MKVKFKNDFANNWKAGQVVEITDLSGKEVLVDGVALIPKYMLLPNIEIIDEHVNTKNYTCYERSDTSNLTLEEKILRIITEYYEGTDLLEGSDAEYPLSLIASLVGYDYKI